MSEHPATARVDRRVLRTKALLADALLALARELPLNEITVATVAERAEVNRSTFYQHYRDIETLLADALDAKATAVGVELSHLDPRSLQGEPPAQLVQYFAHIGENAGLYRMALGPEGSMVTLTRLLDLATRLILEGRGTADDATCAVTGNATVAVPHRVAAAGLAGALVGVLRVWLAETPIAPSDDAARWAWQLVSTWSGQQA